MPKNGTPVSSSWEPVIGLEVHAHLKTRTKMFCRCELEYGAAENTRTCPVCLAHPGALPVPNARAIEMTILLGLALDCEIAERAVFARKNYFYPDLPKGYQISQYEAPLCSRGRFLMPTADGERELWLIETHGPLEHRLTMVQVRDDVEEALREAKEKLREQR